MRERLSEGGKRERERESATVREGDRETNRARKGWKGVCRRGREDGERWARSRK